MAARHLYFGQLTRAFPWVVITRPIDEATVEPDVSCIIIKCLYGKEVHGSLSIQASAT